MAQARTLWFRNFCSTLILFLLNPSITIAKTLSLEPGRVIYQVYTRAFYDGSLEPDGTGDFLGLVNKLDYLEELGIDTLLLMPIFKSTGDMGYIPIDYFSLDQQYGSFDELKELISTAKKNNFKIIIDAPINHISDQSLWFKRGSQKNCDPHDIGHNPNDSTNRYCNYFYFSDRPCETLPYMSWRKPWNYHQTNCHDVWFQRHDFDSVYHRPEQYYATFFQPMPDLKFWDFKTNDFNHELLEEMYRFFDFWINLGVDGFRIDAAKHFIEGISTNANPLEPKNLDLLKKFLDYAHSLNPDISFIGEIWSDHHVIDNYLKHSLDMALDFPFMEALRHSVNINYSESIKQTLKHFENSQELIGLGQRVTFAGNHDVSRIMTEWQDDEQKLRMAHFITLTLPFIPLIYYGEEIGMHGRVKRPDQNSDDEYVQTGYAFSWHGHDQSVGFPGNLTPQVGISDNYQTRNLAKQKADANSTWYFIKHLLALRKQFGIHEKTEFYVHPDYYGHVLGYTLVNRSSQPKNIKCRTIIINLDDKNAYEIEASHGFWQCKGGTTDEVFSESITTFNNKIKLEPYGKVIIGE